jgi:hypothetical protein
MKRLVMATVIGSLLLATTSFAQDGKEGKIQQRKENQQQRIGNGVKNGSLTAGETSKLEHQESKVNKEVRTDRKANGGNLTNNEKKQVNHQQNKMSKEIYNDKHNAAKQGQ